MAETINDGYPDVPEGYFPFAPLEAVARVRFGEEGKEWTDRAFAEIIGKPPRTVGRWRKQGYIPWESADVAAIRIGLHPMNLWPERWMALNMGTEQEIQEALEQVGRVLEAQRTSTAA